MPKRSRLTKMHLAADEVNVQNLKDRLENLDDKTRRKIDYLVKDFKLQRQNRLEDLEESKQCYFKMIDSYFDKIPKIVSRRYLDMKFDNFELENACLTIDYKKFIDKAKLKNLNQFKRDNILKYGGTPAKFKITYSATRRKSQVKSEIRQFELKIISADGSRTIISSAKKSVNFRRPSSGRLHSIRKSKDKSSVDDERGLLRKQREYLMNKIKENKLLHQRMKKEKHNQIDHLFKNITNSLTPEQLQMRISEQEQKNIINHLYSFLNTINQ